MPVTITYTGAKPTVDADFDEWGDILNDEALSPIKTDLDALAVQSNASATLAAAALPKAGGTMTGSLTLSSGGPGGPYEAGYRGAPVLSYDADKTLALTDAGVMQRRFGSADRTLTIPPVGSVGFPVGTIIPLRSFATAPAAWNIARGSGVSLRIAGSTLDQNCVMSAFGYGTLTHEDTNIWVIAGVGIS